jgi:hypothetical protein
MAAVSHLGLFPWCFDPSTPFFSEADLLKYAVPMWWRVKEWTLDIAVEILANTDPPVTTAYSDTKVFKITDYPLRSGSTATFQTEKDLVIAGKAGTGLGSFGPVYDWLFPFFSVPASLSGAIRIGPNFYYQQGEADTPSVSTSGQFEEVGSITSNFCGLSFSAPIKNDIPFGESLYRIVSLESTLTATEYWPYDPNDGGGPIYDSVTGEQLR